jgi:ribosome maturation factor RimP
VDFDQRQALRDRIRVMAEPTLTRLGIDLVAVDLSGDPSEPLLRLSIDKPGGIVVEDCANVNHALSPEFDVDDPIAGPWRLEISSPGIERPVERPSDFDRFAGLTAKIRMAPDWGRQRYVGTLQGTSEDGESIRILVGDTEHVLPRARIDRTRLALTTDEYARLDTIRPAIEGETS